MNKNVFIVCAYPATPIKVKVLKECLRSLRKPNYDIILTTNYKIVDLEIYDLVDYLIYDKTDIKSWVDCGVDNMGDGWYLSTNSFKVSTMFDNAYHYDIYRATYNAISFANSLGYEFFAYIEGDCLLKDFNRLNELRDKTFNENKNLFFGKIHMFPENGGYYDYCTLLYGGNPKFYVNHTNVPYEYQDWLHKPYFLKETNERIFLIQRGLELIIYDCFNEFPNEILELDFLTEMETILEYNRVSKTTDYGMGKIFFFNVNKPDIVYVFLHNPFEKVLDVKMYFNENLYLEQKFSQYEWIMRELSMESILNTKSKLEVYSDGEINTIYEKELSIENIDYMKKTQRFTDL